MINRCFQDDVTESVRSEKLKVSKQGRFWRFREANAMAFFRKRMEK